MTVSCHLLRLMANYFPGSLEEALGCLHVSLLREHRVYQVTITIDCPIQIVPLAIHFHIGFIDAPRVVRSLEMRSAVLLQFGCVMLHPTVDGRVIDM